MMKYWTQTKSKGGGWVDALGTDDKETAIRHARWLRDTRALNTRVVIKTEDVLVTFRAVSYLKKENGEAAS